MLNTKKCTLCSTEKNTTDFGKHSQKIDGLNSWCKQCAKEKDIARSKTPNGLITKIYTSQRQKSKRRNHPMPTYTLEELKSWILAHKHFDYLFNQWVESNYNTSVIPSIDRIDDYKPYTPDNIRLTTWEQNNKRAREDRKNGINNKVSKKVIQYSLDGEYINEFHSINEASRVTNSDSGHISKCCKGIYDKHNGYRWEYSNHTLRR